MRSLYISGPSVSGKTSICVGLALKAQEEGYSVAYFKPVGNVAGAGAEDEDTVLMKELLDLKDAVDTITPFKISPYYLTKYGPAGEMKSTILKSFKTLSKKSDILIVEGAHSPHSMASVGLDDSSIARDLGSDVVAVGRVGNDLDLDQITFYTEHFRARNPLRGVILNNVPRGAYDKAKGVYKDILEERGLMVLGIIPEQLEMTAPTVQEICDVLGGEVLAGKETMQRIVEDILVGAMTLEGALRYFRRSANKAVITGGDRSDIALAALETSTSILILTGNLYPDVKVLARAREKGVAVLLVPNDTYTTIEKLHMVSRKIRPGDERGIKAAMESVDKYCRWREILAGGKQG